MTTITIVNISIIIVAGAGLVGLELAMFRRLLKECRHYSKSNPCKRKYMSASQHQRHIDDLQWFAKFFAKLILVVVLGSFLVIVPAVAVTSARSEKPSPAKASVAVSQSKTSTEPAITSTPPTSQTPEDCN